MMVRMTYMSSNPPDRNQRAQNPHQGHHLLSGLITYRRKVRSASHRKIVLPSLLQSIFSRRRSGHFVVVAELLLLHSSSSSPRRPPCTDCLPFLCETEFCPLFFVCVATTPSKVFVPESCKCKGPPTHSSQSQTPALLGTPQASIFLLYLLVSRSRRRTGARHTTIQNGTRTIGRRE